MTANWSGEELSKIAGADELEVSPRREDGSLRGATPIWVVRDGDELYVRSYRGDAGVWYRTAQGSHRGRIAAGGVTKDVTFVEETDSARNDRIDDAYRTKYGRYPSQYVDPMVAPAARSATLRLEPSAA
ncbi:DUF2255 family protein [Actinomadura rugatobispora]|uniref:DUF2255 family protein n=1 Tax=Actinomadura rugatobispora TaxID=1994 RepID=A0ABW0ZZ91_9ACTN|nr:DUF2255 family protein [Actinomadura rugatobispora]